MGLIEDANQIKLEIKEQIRDRVLKHSIKAADHSRILDEIIDLILDNVGVITPIMLQNLPLIDTLAELAAADLPDYGGYRTSSGFIKLKMPFAPVFTIQPQAQSLSVGANLNLTSLATGAVSYQWYLNGVAINGAINANYSASNIQLAQAGVYTVIASNTAGNTQSNAATVSVNAVQYNINYYGDSLTKGIGTSGTGNSDSNIVGDLTYPKQSFAYLNGNVVVSANYKGFSGQTARWFINNILLSEISSWDQSKNQISVVFFGANDLCQDLSVAEDFYNATIEICQTLKSAGSLVIVVPVLSRKDIYAQNIGYVNIQRRNQFNVWLKENYNDFCDGIVDEDLGEYLYGDDSADDIYWFRKNDVDGLSGVHLTDNGAFYLANMVSRKVSSMLGLEDKTNLPTQLTSSGWTRLINFSYLESKLLKSGGGVGWNANALWNKKIQKIGNGLQGSLTVSGINIIQEEAYVFGLSNAIGSIGYEFIDEAWYVDISQPVVYERGEVKFIPGGASKPYELKIDIYDDKMVFYKNGVEIGERAFSMSEFVYLTATAIVVLENGEGIQNVSLIGNIIDY